MRVADTWREYQANKGLNRYSRAFTLFLGFTMIAFGAVTLLKMLLDLDTGVDFNPYPIFIVSGILVVVLSNRPAMYAVLITSVSLALSIFIMLMDTMFFGHMGAPMTYGIIVTAFCLILVLCSISYFIGNRHNAWRIMVIVIIHAASNVANIAFGLYISGGSWPEVLDACLEDFASIFFCSVFVYYLQQPAVRDDSINALMKTGVSSLEAVAISRSTVYIRDSALMELLGQSRATWRNYQDGPVACEGYSEIIDGKKRFQCVSRIWRGEDFVRVSFNYDIPAHTYGSGFEILSVAYTYEDSGRYVHLYGREGFFVKLRIVGDAEKVDDDDLEEPDDDDYQNLLPDRSY